MRRAGFAGTLIPWPLLPHALPPRGRRGTGQWHAPGGEVGVEGEVAGEGEDDKGGKDDQDIPEGNDEGGGLGGREGLGHTGSFRRAAYVLGSLGSRPGYGWELAEAMGAAEV